MKTCLGMIRRNIEWVDIMNFSNKLPFKLGLERQRGREWSAAFREKIPLRVSESERTWHQEPKRRSMGLEQKDIREAFFCEL